MKGSLLDRIGWWLDHFHCLRTMTYVDTSPSKNWRLRAGRKCISLTFKGSPMYSTPRKGIDWWVLTHKESDVSGRVMFYSPDGHWYTVYNLDAQTYDTVCCTAKDDWYWIRQLDYKMGKDSIIMEVIGSYYEQPPYDIRTYRLDLLTNKLYHIGERYYDGTPEDVITLESIIKLRQQAR
jgi:hypothetical protein